MRGVLHCGSVADLLSHYFVGLHRLFRIVSLCSAAAFLFHCVFAAFSFAATTLRAAIGLVYLLGEAVIFAAVEDVPALVCVLVQDAESQAGFHRGFEGVAGQFFADRVHRSGIAILLDQGSETRVRVENPAGPHEAYSRVSPVFGLDDAYYRIVHVAALRRQNHSLFVVH